MRTDSWKGLVTQASPFALPAGAAVEQVNLACNIPGQLATRGGMRAVASLPAVTAVLDVYPYEYDGKVYLLSLTAAGELIASESPAYGAETPRAAEPQLSVTQGQVATSYTQRYLDGFGGAASDPAPPAQEPEARIARLYGGAASTVSWPYKVNANDLCVGAAKTPAFSAGNAATATVPPSLTPSNLCTP